MSKRGKQNAENPRKQNRLKSDVAYQIAEKQSIITTLNAEIDAIQKDIIRTLESDDMKERGRI